ncbi:MAG: hypothetical protein K2Z80_16905 [Xanthobacteraceae bacterium]|nr:hypothetical protein [Xanthobacteraceae bacterium]
MTAMSDAIANRRSVFKGMFAGAAAISAMGSAGANTPKRLVGVLEEDPPFINSAINSSPSNFTASSLVYSALTFINADGSIEPELAERWEASPDGLKYTFYLRKDVLWHDGEPFTSADVKFSIENATAKLHPWGRLAFKTLDRVETPDRHIAIIHLKTPSASLMQATDIAVSPILPKRKWEGTEIVKNPLNFAPIGTGPFKFVEYVRGQHIRYAKNDRYFEKGKPHIDEIVLRVMPDAAARIAAFEQGQVDMIYWNATPQAELPRLMQRTDMKVTKSPNRGAAFVMIHNLRKAPHNDIRFRRALAHAIDRQFIMKNVDGGLTSAPMLGPVPPVSPLYNKNLRDYEFSAAKANALLDEMGLVRNANGIRHTLSIMWPSWNLAAAKMGDIIHQNLAAIGIGVNLTPLDRATMQQKAYIANDFDLTIEAVALGPDPDIGTERFYNSANIVPGPFVNNSAYRNADVDRMFDEQRVQINFAKRKEIYDKIQEVIWAELPMMSIMAYVPNNIHRSSYATDYFEKRGNGCWENFADAKLVQAAATQPGQSASSSMTWPIVGAGVLAAGLVGAYFIRSRRTNSAEE